MHTFFTHIFLFLIVIASIHISNGFFTFDLCYNISDPNICYERGYLARSPSCREMCCQMNYDQCNPITSTTSTTSTTEAPLIRNNDNNDKSAIFHSNKCIYETSSYLYNLNKLSLNPFTLHSYYYSYLSFDSSGVFGYNNNISLFINICNKSSVMNTEYNNPPHSNSTIHSLLPFITESIIICSKYLIWNDQNTYWNDSVLCTNIGLSSYVTRNIQISDNNNNNKSLTIFLGHITCIYNDNNSPLLQSKMINISLQLLCDPNVTETFISQISGPLFGINSNYNECNQDIKIEMITNIGSCPNSKISYNQSYFSCNPKLFDINTQILNCTLWTKSVNDNHPFIGNMNDIYNKYLNVYTLFAINNNDNNTVYIPIKYDIISNKSGIFNITFNITDIVSNNINISSINNKNWKNIILYANIEYSIGPNGTTSKLFIPFNHQYNHKSVNNLSNYWILIIILFIIIFLCIHLSCRLRDKEAKIFCIYCLRFKCFSFGFSKCMIGTYILCCCSNKKYNIIMDKKSNIDPLNNNNEIKDVTFWKYVTNKGNSKSINNNNDDLATMSLVSAESAFLYKQKSGYGAHVGITKTKSKPSTSISYEEDYVL